VVGVAPGAEHHRAEAELADRYTGASEWSKFHKSSSQLSVAGAALSLDEASNFAENSVPANFGEFAFYEVG